MLDTSINVRTDHFDGPLSLLLLLIQKEEMSLQDLNINKITEQYLSYLQEMKEVNFDLAGDYLYMAATLLLLKSKNCLSDEDVEELKSRLGDGPEITTHSELVRRLEELQKFQQLSQKLWNLPKLGYDIFTKPKVSRKKVIDSILLPMDLQKLTLSMMEFIQKQKRSYTVIRRDRLSIKEKLIFMKNNLVMGQKTTLTELIEKDGDQGIDNIVITFISLLELARLKRIDFYQNEDRGDIYIDITTNLADFNVDEAKGFESEEDLALQKAESEKQAFEEEMMLSEQESDKPKILQ